MLAYTFGQAMWTMLVFFCWILFFWLLFIVFGDLFRRTDIGGWGKAGWWIFVICCRSSASSSTSSPRVTGWASEA